MQVGTQNRSSSLYKKAKELVEQGMIGDVHFVRAFWYRNSLPERSGVALRHPARKPPRRTPTGTVSWAPRRSGPGIPQRYFQWRLYWDYSGGISTDLLVHQTDIVNFMLSKTVPRTCMASGGIYRWRRQIATCRTPSAPFTNIPATLPDQLQLLLRQRALRLRRAVVRQRRHHRGDEPAGPVLHAGDLQGQGARANIKARQPIHLNGHKDFNEGDGAINHFRNFIQAVLGKEQVIAPPPVGQQAAISGHMATLSFKNQKRIVWDRSHQQVPLRVARADAELPSGM